MEAKEPCLDCSNKVIDDYGYFCDIACGKRTAWLNYMAGIKEVVESVTLILRLPHITVDNIKLLWQAKLKEWGNRWQEEKNNGTER